MAVPWLSRSETLVMAALGKSGFRSLGKAHSSARTSRPCVSSKKRPTKAACSSGLPPYSDLGAEEMGADGQPISVKTIGFVLM